MRTVAVISIITVFVVGVFFFMVRFTKTAPTTNITANIHTNTNTSVAANATITWMQTADGWQPSATPPPCPAVMQAPADLNKATSILYPGQTRGGNYKPHGGVRFDTVTDNKITVYMPMSGEVVRGAQYLVGGEIQYTFDVMTPCGLMIRLGHLRELSPTFAAIAATFPAAVEGDSKTTNVNPHFSVTAGDEVATKVGTTKDHNSFFDFGVYNMLTKNLASQNASYAASHDTELAQHALCWFSLMGTTDKDAISKLPAGDPTSGKKSDYCTAADLAF